MRRTESTAPITLESFGLYVHRVGSFRKNRSPQLFTEHVEALATFRRIRNSYMSWYCKKAGGRDEIDQNAVAFCPCGRRRKMHLRPNAPAYSCALRKGAFVELGGYFTEPPPPLKRAHMGPVFNGGRDEIRTHGEV